jgi:hypothetical protein
VAGSLNGHGYATLMPGAQPALAARVNLTAIADKAAEHIGPFPINNFGFICTEDADSPARLETHGPAAATPTFLLIFILSTPRPVGLIRSSIPLLRGSLLLPRGSLLLPRGRGYFLSLLSFIYFYRLLSHDNLLQLNLLLNVKVVFY